MGSAFGTARSGTGIAAAAVMRPEGIMKSILPVVMAGGIYFRRKCFNIIIARYHRHLRSGCCCPHRRAADPAWLHAVPVDKKCPKLHVSQVYLLQGLHPSRRRSLCRPLRPGRRLRGGGGWGLGGQGHGAAVEVLCRTDADTHIFRGCGTFWTYCFNLSVWQKINCVLLFGR